MSLSDPWNRLQVETKRYRDWVEALPEEGRSAEWESDYEGWGAIYEAFTAFIRASAPDAWDRSVIETLVFLAEASLESEEPDARWQLASELGTLQCDRGAAEALLLQFARDEAEYVRRRALIALGELGSPVVAELAEGAWQSGHEY